MTNIQLDGTSSSFDPLLDYLSYYRTISAPGFAVLVSGEWGSGKTYQVKKAIQEDERIYVSLFGMTSENEIYGAVFAQMLPELSNRKNLASWLRDKSFGVWGVSLPIGGLLSFLVDADIWKKVNNAKIIVFDDVERSAIPHSTILGVINRFVEHHDCKVVAIANDSKFDANYDKQKEKVFGHTVRAKPHVKEAYDHFVGQVDVRTQKVLADHRKILFELYGLSGCHSLRVLRQLVLALQRFISLFHDEQIARAPEFQKFFSIFVALAIEVFRGTIKNDHITGRIAHYSSARVVAANANNPIDENSLPAVVQRTFDRYKSIVEILDLSLSDELLVEMLVDGHYDQRHLQKHIASISAFTDSKQQPAWLRFMFFDSNSNEIVELAAQEMDRQFEGRKILDIGEWLHVVSLRIMRIRNGLVAGDVESFVKECLAYLDDLVKTDKFPLQADLGYLGWRAAYRGYSYWGADENAEILRRIRDHVFDCERRVLVRLAPKIRSEILEALTNQPENLSSLLHYDNERQGKYQTVPVLLSLPVADFVEAFLALPIDKWQIVYRALRKLKELVSLNNTLQAEGDWFVKFSSEMVARAEAAAGTIDSLRIKRHIPG